MRALFVASSWKFDLQNFIYEMVILLSPSILFCFSLSFYYVKDDSIGKFTSSQLLQVESR